MIFIIQAKIIHVLKDQIERYILRIKSKFNQAFRFYSWL